MGHLAQSFGADQVEIPHHFKTSPGTHSCSQCVEPKTMGVAEHASAPPDAATNSATSISISFLQRLPHALSSPGSEWGQRTRGIPEYASASPDSATASSTTYFLQALSSPCAFFVACLSDLSMGFDWDLQRVHVPTSDLVDDELVDDVVHQLDDATDPSTLCCGLGPLQRPATIGSIWLSGGTQWEASLRVGMPVVRKRGRAESNLLHQTMLRCSTHSAVMVSASSTDSTLSAIKDGPVRLVPIYSDGKVASSKCSTKSASSSLRTSPISHVLSRLSGGGTPLVWHNRFRHSSWKKHILLIASVYFPGQRRCHSLLSSDFEPAGPVKLREYLDARMSWMGDEADYSSSSRVQNLHWPIQN